MFTYRAMRGFSRARRPTIVRMHHSIVAAGILNATPQLDHSPRRLPFLVLALSALAYLAWRTL